MPKKDRNFWVGYTQYKSTQKLFWRRFELLTCHLKNYLVTL